MSLYAQDLPIIRHGDVIDAPKATFGSKHTCRHLQRKSSDQPKDRLPPDFGPRADPTRQLVVPIATPHRSCTRQAQSNRINGTLRPVALAVAVEAVDSCADRHGRILAMKVIPPTWDATEAKWGWTQPSGSSRVATTAKTWPRAIARLLKRSR
jgi:hypothetical protein